MEDYYRLRKLRLAMDAWREFKNTRVKQRVVKEEEKAVIEEDSISLKSKVKVFIQGLK